MNRYLNLLMAIILVIVLLIPMICIFLAMRITSKESVIYYSKRIGKDGVVFFMPKFRSMTINTPIMATHLLRKSDEYITLIGRFLRQTSLDELPQLLSVLKGDMGFVGPRPALFNQYDLIALRTEKGVDKLLPGITGWAQVNGRDKLSIPDKVALDVEYLNRQSFWFDMKILWVTFLKVMKCDGVNH